jgi:uncharacterized membrane protein (UPF0127 family)
MRFFFETAILIIFAITAVFLYQNYWDDVRYALFGDEPVHTIFIGSTALQVTVADEPEERMLGLSGVSSLRDFEGKLFIFDTDERHGIWMKDMLFPIDIIWIDKNLRVVHIQENALPASYPNQIFVSPIDARFIIEVNAYLVRSVNISVGDVLNVPPSLLPIDIRETLQR